MTDRIKALITQFLEEINFDCTQPVGTESAGRLAEEKAMRDWNHYIVDPQVHAYGLKYLPLCSRISHMTYPDHPVAAKAYCAVYTLFHVLMDPQDHAGVHKIALFDLEKFIFLFGDARKLTDPLLAPYARFLLTETPLHFSPIQTIGLFKSSIDYVLGCLCEQKFPCGFATSAEDFPAWLRYKTGLGEPYAYFFLACIAPAEQDSYLPIIPLVTEYIQYVNDILSTYKEHCTAEQNNYLSHVSRASSISADDALAQLIDKVHEITQKIEVFCAARDLSRFATNLVHGYIAWHIIEDRYRLGGIGITIKHQASYASG